MSAPAPAPAMDYGRPSDLECIRMFERIEHVAAARGDSTLQRELGTLDDYINMQFNACRVRLTIIIDRACLRAGRPGPDCEIRRQAAGLQ